MAGGIGAPLGGAKCGRRTAQRSADTHLHFCMHGQWVATPSKITGLPGTRKCSLKYWREGRWSRGTALSDPTSGIKTWSLRAFCPKSKQNKTVTTAERPHARPPTAGGISGRRAVSLVTTVNIYYQYYCSYYACLRNQDVFFSASSF